jgi:hypothetical protein
MTRSWQFSDVFPVVARLINELYAELEDWVRHDELVSALFDDREGAKLVYDACGPRETESHVAANMVAWFSQQFTTKESAYTEDFDRTKVKGRYAYRPSRPISASRYDKEEVREFLEIADSTEELYQAVSGEADKASPAFKALVRRMSTGSRSHR